MGKLKRYFGKKTQDHELSYKEAGAIVESLHENGAKITKLKICLGPDINKSNPSYDECVTDLETHLAPYQYEFNPNLKGDTDVRHVVRDFETHEIHKFYYHQTFDSLFKKGIKGDTGELEMKVSKI